MRFLFCLPTTALSGGVKVLFELANRLLDAGELVDIFSFAGAPKWFPLKARLIDAKDFEAINYANYDYVLVSNAFMLPLVLPRVTTTRCILFAQDYECFHHGTGKAYSDFMAACPTFDDIYRLPVPIIAISRPVQQLIREHAGRDSFYLPMAINQTIFSPRPRKPETVLKRICFVGNYLMPYKGMQDGLRALTTLATEMPVQLVIVTQERRSRTVLRPEGARLPFPVELHFCPTEEQMPDILASCDVYCCTSWYEGLGLPGLEAFRCGVPVVSTRTYGVLEYGVDDVNLLLAEPNDPHDLYLQLRRVLLDDQLAERLRQAAFQTVENDYLWEASVSRFRTIIDQIDRTYTGPGMVSPSAMQDLLARLEQEGNLTPISVFRQFQSLAAELNALLTTMLDDAPPSSERLTHLQHLRDEFRLCLGNEHAEYYDAFKEKYDLCQLLLGLQADVRFGTYLQLILTRRQDRELNTAASFSEIRYTDT